MPRSFIRGSALSKPVFSDCLVFAGRRNRKSYFLLMACLFGLSLVVGFATGVVVGLATVDLDPYQSERLAGMAASLVCLPLGYLGMVATAQRCRDLGWSGWSALLAAVPIIGWIFMSMLLAIKGNAGSNRYGPDPLGFTDGSDRARTALEAA